MARSAGGQEGRKEAGNTTISSIAVWQTVNHSIQSTVFLPAGSGKTCLYTPETKDKQKKTNYEIVFLVGNAM